MFYAKCTAKRFGDQVKFVIEDATDSKDAYEKAKQEANYIFGYKTGEAGAPTVSVDTLVSDSAEEE